MKIDNWQTGEAIEGFSRADCAPFRGDEKCAPLTWKGGAKAPVDGALLRIVLTDALLYGFEWRQAEQS